MTINDELQGLIKLLRNAKIEYALCGGLAMAVHGWPRSTMDIDILIEKKTWRRRVIWQNHSDSNAKRIECISVTIKFKFTV